MKVIKFSDIPSAKTSGPHPSLVEAVQVFAKGKMEAAEITDEVHEQAKYKNYTFDDAISVARDLTHHRDFRVMKRRDRAFLVAR